MNKFDVLFWTQLLAASEWAIRLTMLPVIVLRKEKPATCLAWLAVVFFEPWIGLGLYLLIGENRLGRRRLARRRQRRPQLARLRLSRASSRATSSIPTEADDFSVLVHLAEHVGGLPVVAGNSISLMSRHRRGHRPADGRHRRRAASRPPAVLHLQGRRGGPAGGARRWPGRPSAAWCAACWPTAVGSRRLFRRLAPWLRRHGVRILPVLPATLWRLPFARLDLRNHRKLAVIDGTVAFTGSQNIVEASYGHKRAGVWHDVMARITGPVVRQLQGIFLEDWFYESGELLEDAALFPPCPADGPIAVQVVPTGPDQPTELFQDLIVRAIFLARRRVVITSPYFIPNEAMLLALRLAALRGRAGRSGDPQAQRPSDGRRRRQFLLRISDAARRAACSSSRRACSTPRR